MSPMDAPSIIPDGAGRGTGLCSDFSNWLCAPGSLLVEGAVYVTVVLVSHRNWKD